MWNCCLEWIFILLLIQSISFKSSVAFRSQSVFGLRKLRNVRVVNGVSPRLLKSSSASLQSVLSLESTSVFSSIKSIPSPWTNYLVKFIGYYRTMTTRYRIFFQSLSFVAILALLVSESIKRKPLNVAKIIPKIKETGKTFQKLWDVWTFAITFTVKCYFLKLFNSDNSLSNSKAMLALFMNFKDKLVQLGPTYIKLGQLLSTRIDILPKELTQALSSLQDQVPCFDGDIAVNIIEQEFGSPITALYDYFNKTPIAAASLGQVHRAVYNGKQVAVKVQRPGLKEQFNIDMRIINTLTFFLDRLLPKSYGPQVNWLSISREYEKLLYQEIDYEVEAANAARFLENFKDCSWVKVPKVYLPRTSRKVLCMEYVPGIKINQHEQIEAAGIDRTLLAKRNAESYLSQLCRHGFFHCDPHPGNVACDASEGGRLIYYDFGMMNELRPNVRQGLIKLAVSVYESDAKKACDALEEIGILRQGVDRVSVEKVCGVLLSDIAMVFDSGVWWSSFSDAERREIERKRRIQLASDFFAIRKDMPFVFPAAFTFVFRAFTTLDGIGKGLDPSYDLVKLARPYLKELIEKNGGQLAYNALKSTVKRYGWGSGDIPNPIQMPGQIARMDKILTRIEKGDLLLRTRSIDSELSFQRIDALLSTMTYMVTASIFVNLSTYFGLQSYSSSASRISIMFACICGALAMLNAFSFRNLHKMPVSYV